MMKPKITFSWIIALICCFPLYIQASPLEGKKIVVDTFAFIYAAVFHDSMVHIVWDRNNQTTTATYILEKSSDNGVNFKEVARISDTSTPMDLIHQDKHLINPVRNVLYTTEGGFMRFIYNEVIGSMLTNLKTLYRVRTEISEELIIYTESVNCLSTKDEPPHKHSKGKHPSPPTLQSCPSIGSPPAGYSNSGVTNTYTSNCCTITETKYTTAGTSCSLPSNIAPCVPSDPIDCACSCTWDWCCIHDCSQYAQCGCVPWTPCTSGSSGGSTWIVTAVSPIGNNPSAGSNADICLGQSTQLNATGGQTYSWSPTTGLSDPNIGNPVATPTVTTTYTVSAPSPGGCPGTDAVTVFVHPIPVPDFTASLSCAGQVTNFTNLTTVSSGTIAGLSWDFGDSSPLNNTQNPTHTYANTGIYTVTLTTTSDQGCTFSKSIPVVVYPVPVAAFSSNSVCLNFPTLFVDQSTVTGDVVSVWAWDFGDSSNVNTLQNPSHTYTADGTFTATLIATSNNGCANSISLPVIVYPLPVAKFTVDDSAGCINHCVIFTNSSTVTSGTNDIWEWDFGDTQNGTGQLPEHCYTIPGTYTVTLITTTNFGCKDTLVNNSMITAYPLPVAGFSGDPLVTTMLTPTVEFKDKSSGATQWLYNFGDGSPTDNAASPTHLFPDFNDADHTYIVHQLVTNQWGCIDTTDITIVIKPDYAFYVPNSFSPNNDGKNDYFFGSGIGIIDYEMLIFDRWGNLIWSCKTKELPQLSTTCKWDGKVTNTTNGAVQEDVYVWTVQLVDVFKKKHSFTGRVTVVK